MERITRNEVNGDVGRFHFDVLGTSASVYASLYIDIRTQDTPPLAQCARRNTQRSPQPQRWPETPEYSRSMAHSPEAKDTVIGVSSCLETSNRLIYPRSFKREWRKSFLERVC